MWRWIVNRACGISLALFVVTVFCWITTGSKGKVLNYTWWVDDSRCRSMCVIGDGGQADVAWGEFRISLPGSGQIDAKMARYWIGDDAPPEGITLKETYLWPGGGKYTMSRNDYDESLIMGYTHCGGYFGFPLYAPTALFALLPAWWVVARFHASRRKPAGHCSACDYDLRATPSRCPECGNEMTNQQTGITNQ